MTHYPISKDTLEQALTLRINESEAEIEALKKVVINTAHKTLTNRSVEGGTIGDYIGLGKALYVYYTANGRYQKRDISAYTYNNPDGTEIGTEGISRISRTMTPAELDAVLQSVIIGLDAYLLLLKKDLINAKKNVDKYNALMTQVEALRESTTWATRGVLK